MNTILKPSLPRIVLFLGISGLFMACDSGNKGGEALRPNILILMSDNHSWDHLGCYGDQVIKTPVIDQLAADGIRFTQAFCSAPSCAPARAAMLAGQDFFRLEEAANLWGSFPSKFPVYTDLLEQAGYLVGHEGKGWGPGDYASGGWTRNPAGNKYNSFEEFINEKERGQPFCYWFSSRDPHRPYKSDGWKEAEIDTNQIVVPPYLPSCPDVKMDIGDYYAEIQQFDRDVNSFLQLLKETGEFENTMIVVCSDNGWQMPRGLANLYDFGTKVPLVISMPSQFKGGRVIDDFISLNDFAPTFLELAGIPIPEEMNARSFAGILLSDRQGITDDSRDFLVMGRERHAYVRKNGDGYGGRAYRTKDFLYIRNYDPERWPAGDPPLFGDVDAHMLHYPCLTKMYMLVNREKEEVKPLFELGFGKRPAEELYDLNKDPWQMANVAQNEAYRTIKEDLSNKQDNYLNKNSDPRALGIEMKWIGADYFTDRDKNPRPSEEARKLLGLEEEYSY